MFFSTRRDWTLARVPDLTLDDDVIVIDIGFLSGDAHREAFASIFAKLIKDNGALTEDAILRSVDAPRAVRTVGFGAECLPVRMNEVGPLLLERALYDSGNETVLLELDTVGGRRVIGLRFDDPEFWLETPLP